MDIKEEVLLKKTPYGQSQISINGVTLSDAYLLGAKHQMDRMIRLGYRQPDEKAALPKLLSLTGEASMEEKSAYLLGTKDMGEQILKSGWHRDKEEK